MFPRVNYTRSTKPSQGCSQICIVDSYCYFAAYASLLYSRGLGFQVHSLQTTLNTRLNSDSLFFWQNDVKVLTQPIIDCSRLTVLFIIFEKVSSLCLATCLNMRSGWHMSFAFYVFIVLHQHICTLIANRHFISCLRDSVLQNVVYCCVLLQQGKEFK